MEWNQEWQDEDSNTYWTGRTARMVKYVVNSSNKSLRCTVEKCEDFKDGRLPTLDTNIWIQDGKILNTFFEKQMSAKQ